MMMMTKPKIEEITVWNVRVGDVISVNGGNDFLKVWSVAMLRNGRNMGLRFVERDASGRRYYANLRTDNRILRYTEEV